MRTITYSNFRNDLKSNLKQLRDDADVLLVTNRDPADNVVVMNERDYESMPGTSTFTGKDTTERNSNASMR